MAKRLPRKRTTSTTSDNPAWMMPVIVAAVVLGVGLLIFLLVQASVPSQTVAATSTPFPEIEGVVQATEAPGRDHDENVTYEFDGLPPWGGTHNPIWQNCGIYQNPVRTENVIHSLEHGAVWVTYQPDLPESEVETLREAVRNNSYILMSPYPNQPSPIVLTAWGVQLELESPTDARIRQFIDFYEQGPQTPEPGGACSGGLGFSG